MFTPRRPFGSCTPRQCGKRLTLGLEDPKLRDRYGRNKLGQSVLLARRLVEAGVRFVTVYDGQYNGQTANWDSHENVFGRLKNDLAPPADQSFAALIADLGNRGLLDETLVIAMGEFGRTPKINASAGRDHWPNCYSVVLAGGGVRGGITFGSSDKMGAYPDSDAVSPGDLAATLFWRFGLDPVARDCRPDRPAIYPRHRPANHLAIWIMLCIRAYKNATQNRICVTDS